MKIRFYLDEDTMDADLVEAIRARGIDVARQQHYSVGEQMRRLLSLMSRLSAEEMRNRLEFLSDWGPDR